ncbi:MAG: DUF4292 domain-containing protein [Syntrophales bacterium]|nr:DUF4292 domain-containing protein [Syntrophales bacterium]
MKLLLKVTLVSSVLVFLTGCATAPKTAELTVCQPPMDVLGKTVTAGIRKGTMKVLADMEIQAMGKKYPARMAIMARGPQQLRMEAIPLFGPPDFMLSITGDRMRVFLPEKGEFYVGDSAKHLSCFIPLPIDVLDIVPVLMGGFPPIKKGDCFSQEVPEGDLRRVDVLSPGGDIRMSLWLKWPDQDLIRFKKYGEDDKPEYTVVFSNHTLVNEISMPEKIVIRKGGIASINQTITIRYSDLEFTGNGEQEIFDLPIPAGLTPINLKDQQP